MPLSSLPHVRGLVLAAGSGSRMGRPKALIRLVEEGPTLVERAVAALSEGGCDGVTVVVGAASDDVREVLTPAAPDSTRVASPSTGQVPDLDLVECPDWSEGMGASLRTGLSALAARSEVEAVVITLVDLPDLVPAVVRRLLEVTTAEGPWRVGLSRAAYGGVPGHPTLIGRDHWAGAVALARGDRGARDYFGSHPHSLVECGDLSSGRDVDSPEDLDT